MIVQVYSKQSVMKWVASLLIFSSSVLSPAYAQMSKIWDKVLGSIDKESPVLISKNPSGTVDVISSVAGTGAAGNAQGFDVTTGYGGYDYWFCKLDKSGQKIPGSDKTYGGSGNDEAISAIRTTDGGYLICGKSKTTPLPTSNTSVLWVVKIDTMGTVKWQKQVDLHVAPNGSADLTGDMAVCNTSSGYAIAVTTYAPGASNNYSTFLVLFDLVGNQAAVVTLSTNSSVSNILLPKSISQMANGNLLIGGSNGSRGYAMRVSASGATILFANLYASNGASAIISAKELSNGKLLFFLKSIHDNLSGSSRSVNSKASSGNYDIWTFQTNSSGVGFSNERAIGCGALNLPDNANILELANVYYYNDKAFLLLEPNATGLDRVEANKGSTDYWLVEYDYTNNVVVKENSFGGSGTEQVQSLCIDNDGTNAYLLGTSASVISGDKTEALKSGSSDLWAVKTCLGANAAVVASSPFVFGFYVGYTCEGQSKKIDLDNPDPSYTYTWHDAATGGNLFAAGTSYTLPSVGATGTQTNIWIESHNGGCSNSATRTMVKIAAIKTPNKPTITGNTALCKNDNLSLTAIKDVAGQQNGTYIISHWYDATGTVLLSTKDVFTINNIQQSINLILTSVDSLPPAVGFSGLKCESQSLSISVKVDEALIPLVSYTNPTCLYNQTTLTATNSSSNAINWYDNTNSLIYTGNPLIYTSNELIDTIYAEMQTPNGCLSAKKQIIIKVQHITPDRPSFQNTFYSFGQQIFPTCSNSSATINVDLPTSGYIYNWYDVGGGGAIVHTGSTYTLPNIDYNTVYEFHVSSNDGFCESGKTDVLIQPIKTPGLPKITSSITTICYNETLTLIAQKDTSTHPGGVFYNRWYNTSNQLLHTGDTLVVPNIQNTATYYCATVDSYTDNYYPGLGP